MNRKIKMSDFWFRQKSYDWNNTRIIFIIVWCFYKTYFEDAKFLNEKLWLNINQQQSCIFPIKWWNKYFEYLREYKYSFSVFDIIEWRYMRLIDEYNWGMKLK